MPRCLLLAALALLTLALPVGVEAQPTVDITWDEEQAYTAATLEVTFTFSEAVRDFEAEDLLLEGGTTVETFRVPASG